MKKRIVLAGGAGFLGQVLANHFLNVSAAGGGPPDSAPPGPEAIWDVVILTRSPGQPGLAGRQVGWNARTLGPWSDELEGATAVINLTGKSVNCRYNARNRRAILDSRVDSTRVIGEAIGRCANPPQVWMNASTATLYRHTFGEPWDETGKTEASDEAKDRFSVEVGWAWEKALNEAATPRTRKIALRMAMVLGLGKNSVFPVLRRLARVGLGGRMGSGRQFVSWIHETDLCRAIAWLIAHPEIHGPVNLTAPNPVPNAEMMKLLRQACGVPLGLPATEWMLEIGAFLLRTETELLIKSRRVIPGRLLGSGFEFQFPTMGEAFEELVRRSR